MTDLDKLAALEAKATAGPEIDLSSLEVFDGDLPPGPWGIDTDGVNVFLKTNSMVEINAGEITNGDDYRTACDLLSGIAEMRNSLPALIDAAESLNNDRIEAIGENERLAQTIRRLEREAEEARRERDEAWQLLEWIDKRTAPGPMACDAKKTIAINVQLLRVKHNRWKKEAASHE